MKKRHVTRSGNFKRKVKRIMNFVLGFILFIFLIGSAFAISILFGFMFVVGFLLSVYNKELLRKPWKPLAIFIGALVVRFAISKYVNPIFASKTLIDLSVSALVFLFILILGWKIKKS